MRGWSLFRACSLKRSEQVDLVGQYGGSVDLGWRGWVTCCFNAVALDLATSPDAVRKPTSEKTPRAQEGVRTGTVAYQAVVYSPVGNRSTCQVRGKG